MDDFTPQERWAVALGLRKLLDDILDGKREDSIRALLDSELLADYVAGRADRKPVRVRGKKIGSLYVRSTPAHTEARLYMEEPKDYAGWLCTEGRQYLERFLGVPKCADMMLKFSVDAVLLDGEVPAGCSFAYEDVPEQVTTAYSGITPQKVADALGAELPGAVLALMTPEEA